MGTESRLAEAGSGSGNHSPRLRRALALADEAHRRQHRTDGRPYVGHAVEVFDELVKLDADETVLIAGVLHDVVEKSNVSFDSLEAAFGPTVSALVAALTEDPSIAGWVPRKAALRAQVALAGGPAATIYAADKLVNLREIRALYRRVGEHVIDLRRAPTVELKIDAWWQDLKTVTKCGVPAPLYGARRDELSGFEEDREARAAPA